MIPLCRDISHRRDTIAADRNTKNFHFAPAWDFHSVLSYHDVSIQTQHVGISHLAELIISMQAETGRQYACYNNQSGWALLWWLVEPNVWISLSHAAFVSHINANRKTSRHGEISFSSEISRQKVGSCKQALRFEKELIRMHLKQYIPCSSYYILWWRESWICFFLNMHARTVT